MNNGQMPCSYTCEHSALPLEVVAVEPAEVDGADEGHGGRQREQRSEQHRRRPLAAPRNDGD